MVFATLGIASCSKPMSRYNKQLDKAEKLMWSNPDSALSILDAIDPYELKQDSLQAKYHYLKGYGHLSRNRSMIGDSLISIAHEYYRGKDIVRDVRSGMVLAWYKFWIGDTPGALSMLDSLSALSNVPDSVMVQTLRVRILLGASEYQGRPLIPVSYINRLTFETGNPWLKPTKMQTVEYMAQWRQFFAQLSYTYFKDGVYHITEPYGTDGEASIIRTANLDHRHYFQAFVGGQFKVGIWQPRVNVGVMKQWLTLLVDGKPMKMNTPGFLFQWQNAVHLPFDIWLNVDAQLMTRSWDNNMKLSNTPCYVNAKIYKGFLNNAFSVTLEAKDLFNTSQHDAMMFNDAVKIEQKNYSPGRSVMLTLQYRFNTTRDRYRGAGAGNSEKSRF